MNRCGVSPLGFFFVFFFVTQQFGAERAIFTIYSYVPYKYFYFGEASVLFGFNNEKWHKFKKNKTNKKRYISFFKGGDVIC